jgi:hypothetical protein
LKEAETFLISFYAGSDPLFGQLAFIDCTYYTERRKTKRSSVGDFGAVPDPWIRTYD